MRRFLFLALLLLTIGGNSYAQKQTVRRQTTTKHATKSTNTAAKATFTASQRQAAEQILDNMVNVEGGSFNSYDNAHHTVSSYRIGRYEVTQKEWKAIMGNNPSHFKGDNLPVEQVSWRDVETFINRLNAISGRKFRLPTEAEWEFAAKGGNKTNDYAYSGSSRPAEVAWYGLNSGDCTHPVGKKKPNELGLYDMSGNVAEWCHDWWGNDYDEPGASYVNYQGSPVNYQGRIVRGGSYSDSNTSYLMNHIRSNSNHNTRVSWLGFRLAL